jgi:protein tyrosine phosphatase (PTP) superfamily phosphohydrolase (DUF442 family)
MRWQRRRERIAVALVLSLVFAWATSSMPVNAAQPKKPNPLLVANGPGGLHNFWQVAPGLYRGAQPDKSQLEGLKQLGIKTVVSLRHNQYQVSKERKQVEALGMTFKHLSMDGLRPPNKATINSFLATAQDRTSQPVFVHCEVGADRTGCLIAIYREAVDDWSAKKAYDEMVSKGFEKKYAWLSDAVFDYEEDHKGIYSKERPANVKLLDSLRLIKWHRKLSKEPSAGSGS